MTLNCTKDSVSKLTIVVSLSFALAEDHSFLTTVKQTAQVWEKRLLNSNNFKLNVSLSRQFYENLVPTKRAFKKYFYTKISASTRTVVVMLRAWLTPSMECRVRLRRTKHPKTMFRVASSNVGSIKSRGSEVVETMS